MSSSFNQNANSTKIKIILDPSLSSARATMVPSSLCWFIEFSHLINQARTFPHWDYLLDNTLNNSTFRKHRRVHLAIQRKTQLYPEDSTKNKALAQFLSLCGILHTYRCAHWVASPRSPCCGVKPAIKHKFAWHRSPCPYHLPHRVPQLHNLSNEVNMSLISSIKWITQVKAQTEGWIKKYELHFLLSIVYLGRSFW